MLKKMIIGVVFILLLFTASSTTSNYNPVSGGAGNVAVADATFTTARDQTTGEYVDTSSSINAGCDYAGVYYVYRTFLPFDTSGIPDDVTIESAEVYFYVVSGDPDGYTVIVANTTQASYSGLSTSDYQKAGDINNSIEVSDRVAGTDLPSNDYINYTISTDSLKYINKTSITNFALLSTADIDNIACTNDEGKISSTLSNAPYIRVTYTAVVDTTPPGLFSITSTSPTPDDTTEPYYTGLDQTPTFTFTTNESATCGISTTNSSFTECGTTGATNQICTSSSIDLGTDYVYVNCTDGASNSEYDEWETYTSYLQGNVTDGSLGLKNALVTVSFNDSTTVLYSNYTNDTGYFTIPISNGTYTVCAYLPSNNTLGGSCSPFVEVAYG